MVVEHNDAHASCRPDHVVPPAARDVAGASSRTRSSGCASAGVEVEVVSPADFRHFGLAYGAGIVGNLRRGPGWRCSCRLFLLSFALAAVRARAARTSSTRTGSPRRLVGAAHRQADDRAGLGDRRRARAAAAWLARRLLPARAGRRRAVDALAAEARGSARGGARDPERRRRSDEVGDEDEPPFVALRGPLFAGEGRARARRGRGRDPARRRRRRAAARPRAGARGFVPHDELCGSTAGRRRRGPVVPRGLRRRLREAMAHGRPVVASAVGGLLDLVVDGETGIHVPPGDVPPARRARAAARRPRAPAAHGRSRPRACARAILVGRRHERDHRPTARPAPSALGLRTTSPGSTVARRSTLGVARAAFYLQRRLYLFFRMQLRLQPFGSPTRHLRGGEPSVLLSADFWPARAVHRPLL